MFQYCSTGDHIQWKDLNPYNDTEFNFSKYLGHDLCAENMCLQDFKEAIENKWNFKVRASCEEDTLLKLTVCWLRLKEGIGNLHKRTKWELQYWTEKQASHIAGQPQGLMTNDLLIIAQVSIMLPFIQ
ncbi:hypothetical protein WDU94_008408 [Cyamophila willieti]